MLDECVQCGMGRRQQVRKLRQVLVIVQLLKEDLKIFTLEKNQVDFEQVPPIVFFGVRKLN